MRSLVFVCTGNICRSAMAEAMARRTLAGTGLQVESAGLYALEGAPASEHARTAVAETGADAEDHVARPVTREMVERADRIYVMTDAHRTALLHMGADLEDKVELLDPSGENIADPYGEDLEFYRDVRDRIAAAIEVRLGEWIPE
jgi:protein-tyrosine-phosphatase